MDFARRKFAWERVYYPFATSHLVEWVGFDAAAAAAAFGPSVLGTAVDPYLEATVAELLRLVDYPLLGRRNPHSGMLTVQDVELRVRLLDSAWRDSQHWIPATVSSLCSLPLLVNSSTDGVSRGACSVESAW